MWNVQKRSLGILVVDVQERLSKAMPSAVLESVCKNIVLLCKSAALLEVPIFVTEQYPRGLGGTLEQLKTVLPQGHTPLEKLHFSAYAEGQIKEAIDLANKDQWVICGMETHICIFQTARDLRCVGKEIFVPQDAVCSRTEQNWNIGIDMIEACGAHIVSTESLLFDALHKAEGETFKMISRWVK